MKNLLLLFFFFKSILAYADQVPRNIVLSDSKYATPRISLEEKLSAQWKRYESARKALLNAVRNIGVPVQNRQLSRSDWEGIIQLPGELSFTPRDFIELRNSQRKRIQSAKLKAARRSKVDFEAIRNLPLISRHNYIQNFCRNFPKGGMLHVHPTGTLDRKTVERLLVKTNPILQFQGMLKDIRSWNAMLYPNELNWMTGKGIDQSFLSLSAVDQAKFQDFYFLPSGKQPFGRFNSVFVFLSVVTSNWTNYYDPLLDFSKRAVSEGVSYVEITEEISPNLIEAIRKIENETGLMIRVNHAFNRTNGVNELETQLLEILKMQENPELLGIDFLDDETQNPALEKGQILYGTLLSDVLQGRSKLHRTMHAGELGDIRNPRDAMIMGVERLGHGILLNDDPVALEYAAKNHIAVEVNLSSNLRLTSIEKISSHPFLDYLRLGIPVSLSTDDEGIFEIDINHECELAISESDVTYAEIKQMSLNSISTSFASETDKSILKQKLLKSLANFESYFLGR